MFDPKYRLWARPWASRRELAVLFYQAPLPNSSPSLKLSKIPLPTTSFETLERSKVTEDSWVGRLWGFRLVGKRIEILKA